LLITNEYYHQTTTSTFLAAPPRTSGGISKFVVAMLAAGVVWGVTTAIDLAAALRFMNAERARNAPRHALRQRARLINLRVWAVFGIGLGALIRSQIGATVTAALLYTIGIYAAGLIFFLLRQYVFHTDAVFKGLVLVPAVAAQIAEGAISLPNDQQLSWWWG